MTPPGRSRVCVHSIRLLQDGGEADTTTTSFSPSPLLSCSTRVSDSQMSPVSASFAPVVTHSLVLV